MNPIFLETILVCVGFFLLLSEAFLSNVRKEVFGWAAALTIAIVFGLSFLVDPNAINPTAPYAAYYSADALAMFFKQLSLVATFLVLLLAFEFAPVFRKYIPSKTPGSGTAEFYSLALFACAGMMWMVSATDFILIFVALELVTVTFYVLVAYLRRNLWSLEAGVKYLILGALSTGFLVYGITWIFGVTGTTSLVKMTSTVPELGPQAQISLLFGLGLVLVALGFKVAAVPFQFWVPDVYQGAPTPVTAFLSVASKAAGFVVLLRVLEPFLQVPFLRGKLLGAIAVLAGLSMLLANFAAIPQTNLKRLLAYSSIAHAGYLLMAVASVGSGSSGMAISFYLAVYLIMTMLAFAVLIVVTNAVGGDNISDFNGLGKRAPWLAAALSIGMLSLAGLPFTAGFFGKFFLFAAALADGQIVLVVLGAVSVACGFYYYLKVLRAMYWMQDPGEGSTGRIETSPALTIVLLVLVLLTLFLGIYPQPLISVLPA
jgi:NADH-quinone oxidoreductase subunit N